MSTGFTQFIERLENRQLLSAAHAWDIGPAPANLPAASSLRSTIKRSSGQAGPADPRVETASLQAGDVRTVLAQAASQARRGQVIAVVDRGGNLLGIYAGSGVGPADLAAVEFLAVQRARTAAFFESTQDAFTTRTARFIIQNHFPQPISDTPGGPLYGVEFSSFPGGDVIPSTKATGLSGDPGGVPLFVDGIPVGGIGVAGDGHDAAPNADLRNVLESELPAKLIALGGGLAGLGESLQFYENRAIGSRVFNGNETSDVDESVAIAGAKGFAAPMAIRATQITINGLRLPFTNSPRARGRPNRSLEQLAAAGAGGLVEAGLFGLSSATTIQGTPDATPGNLTTPATYANVPGQLVSRGANLDNSVVNSPVLSNGVPELTTADVTQVFNDAVSQAAATRGGIRKPNGAKAKVWVTVCDTQGNVLGVFRMGDATNFSYDVAIQKARTAAFFSDNDHAFSTRAIGFMSQQYFPPGINGGETGPLYRLQDELMTNPANLTAQGINPSGTNTGPLANGITIFPGGVPLYKDGQLVGAVGVSGDGVDQDDIIAFTGEHNYRPRDGIRSDQLAPSDATQFLVARLQAMAAIPGVSLNTFDLAKATRLLSNGLSKVHLPYTKFPRNPTTP